ncbi:MAG: glycosyltransferase family 4 protein [Armatimonadetes bacterium]|nr:glycosyltransferase family 4 protein [Armatimonadota bacterium]
MLNITYIANATALGGAEHYLLLLLNGLTECRCRVYMPESPVTEEFATRAGGIPVELLSTDGYSMHPMSFVKAMRFYGRLKCDILHFNLVNPCASTVDILAARLLGNSRIVLTTHLPTITYSLREKLSSRLAIRSAHRVITVCNTAREYVLDMGVPTSKVVSVYNGVRDWDTPPGRVQEIRRELGIGESGICLGTVARLEEQKGLRYLLEAFALVVHEDPRSVLCILGDGSQRSELEETALRLHVHDRVRFLGWRNDYLDFLRAFDVFVLPSLFESFPFAVVEAMMAGKAVIASDVGGVGEAVLDELTGLLVQPRDFVTLAKAMLGLIRSSKRREAFGERARVEARNRFGLDSMISNTLAVYEDAMCIGRSGGRK